jgi:hypothetical protein
MKRGMTVWALLVPVAGLMAGCGGATFQGETDAGGHDARNAEDGGHDAQTKGDAPPGDAAAPWSPVCPENAPTVGSLCTVPDQTTCEYGLIQYDIDCDTVLQCQSGAWTKFSTFGTCVPDGPNGAACPATFADVPQGQDCAPAGTTCEYSAGVCTCSMSLGGPIRLGDGGDPATWMCNPGTGCPMPRPRLGTACSAGAETDCTYESCEFGESCSDGVWQGQEEGCAEPG